MFDSFFDCGKLKGRKGETWKERKKEIEREKEREREKR